MSADNWRGCPRCIAVQEEEHKTLKDFAYTSYGFIPESDYLALQRRIESYEPIDPQDEGNFAEYYEFYILPDTTEVVASYGGECTECGFSIKFKHVHPFEVKA